MPKKKAKKRKRKNPLQVRIQLVNKPVRMKPKTYLRTLLQAISTGEMPDGLEVELHWRNPATRQGRTKNWQSDEFTNAISESSAGFAGVVRRSIERKLIQLRG